MTLSSRLASAKAAQQTAAASLPGWMTTQTAAGIGYSLAQQGVGRARGWINQKRTWTVSVSGDDELYFDAQFWLMSQSDQAATRRAVRAHTLRRFDMLAGGPQERIELRFLADDDQPQDVWIDGFKVSVFVDDHEGHARRAGSQSENMQLLKPPKLVFNCRSRAARDAVIQKLHQIRQDLAAQKRRPGLMVLDKWGEWNRRSDLPPRPLESVILKGRVLDDLHTDLQEFMTREPDYVRRAIPYHRAYLLIGPPGTGKTSTVKAVTNALATDLWYAQLSGIEKDTKLADVFGAVRSRGVLLLEDIDSLPAASDRSGDEPAEGDISTSGLLNALDGVATPHGLVTVMTTNHPEHLDEALLRPGRIDRIFTFEHPDRDTLQRHFEFFYGRRPHRSLDPGGRSSATISEIFKRHMDDPDAAEAAFDNADERARHPEEITA